MHNLKYVPGFSWCACGGERRIIGQAKDRPEGWLAILNADGSDSYVHISDMAHEVSWDKSQYENWLDEKKKEDALTEANNAKNASWHGYGEDFSPMRKAKVRKYLEKMVRFENKVMSIKDFIEMLVSRGMGVSQEQENKIKDMSARAYFRTGKKEQDAHEAKILAAGEKTVYFLGDYKISKTEYDYAKWLGA